MAKEKERAHSILPASGAHKWLYCPPSARLEDEIPDKAGMAADEGTLAHGLCELKLSKIFTDQNMSAGLRRLRRMNYTSRRWTGLQTNTWNT